MKILRAILMPPLTWLVIYPLLMLLTVGLLIGDKIKALRAS